MTEVIGTASECVGDDPVKVNFSQFWLFKRAFEVSWEKNVGEFQSQFILSQVQAIVTGGNISSLRVWYLWPEVVAQFELDRFFFGRLVPTFFRI